MLYIDAGYSLGRWSGFCGDDTSYPSQSMITIDLHASTTNTRGFESQGVAPNGTDWKLEGEYRILAEEKVDFTFKITYETRYTSQTFTGQLDASGTMLSGYWFHSDTDSLRATRQRFPFLFKQLAPEVVRFYPTPTELADNKPKALWRFAISAVRDQLYREKKGSWSWLLQRWKTGHLYAQLIMRMEASKLRPEEVVHLARCWRNMTPGQARLFNILIDICERSIPTHWCVPIVATSMILDGAQLTTTQHLGEYDVMDAETVSEEAVSFASPAG